MNRQKSGTGVNDINDPGGINALICKQGATCLRTDDLGANSFVVSETLALNTFFAYAKLQAPNSKGPHSIKHLNVALKEREALPALHARISRRTTTS